MSNDTNIDEILREIEDEVPTITPEEVLKKFEALINEQLNKASLNIFMNDQPDKTPVVPTLYVADEIGCESTELQPNETTDHLAELMRTACKNPKVIVAGIIFDALTKSIPVNDVPIYEDHDLNQDPDKNTSLIALIYTREKTKIRVMPHAKKEDGKRWNADYGWKVLTDRENMNERLSNPFH